MGWGGGGGCASCGPFCGPFADSLVSTLIFIIHFIYIFIYVFYLVIYFVWGEERESVCVCVWGGGGGYLTLHHQATGLYVSLNKTNSTMPFELISQLYLYMKPIL